MIFIYILYAAYNEAFWQPFPPHPNYKKISDYKNIFIVNHAILCGSLSK